MARWKGLRGLEPDSGVGDRRSREAPAGRAELTGIAGIVQDTGSVGQVNGGGGALDLEVPAVAGHIPVEFVELIEEPELAGRAVGDLIGVAAGPKKHVLVADIEPDAVAAAFGEMGLGTAVAGDPLNVEGDDGPDTPLGPVLGRKVPEDAALDLIAGADDRDGLLHGHGRVLMDADVAVETQYAFMVVGQRRARGEPQAE